MFSLEQKLDKFLFIHFQIYRSVPIFVSLIQLQFILGKFRDIRKKNAYVILFLQNRNKVII